MGSAYKRRPAPHIVDEQALPSEPFVARMPPEGPRSRGRGSVLVGTSGGYGAGTIHANRSSALWTGDLAIEDGRAALLEGLALGEGVTAQLRSPDLDVGDEDELTCTGKDDRDPTAVLVLSKQKEHIVAAKTFEELLKTCGLGEVDGAAD